MADGTRVTIRQVAYWPSLPLDVSTVTRIVNTVDELSGVVCVPQMYAYSFDWSVSQRHRVLARYHGTETADGLAVDGHHRLTIISSWAPGNCRCIITTRLLRCILQVRTSETSSEEKA